MGGLFDFLSKFLGSLTGMRCPECGSWAVEEVKRPSFSLGVSGKTTRCRCKKCGYEWDCIKISSV